MTDLPLIGIVGASGRMGQMLIESVVRSKQVSLGGAIEKPDHPWVGEKLNSKYPGITSGMVIGDSPDTSFSRVNIIIDFSNPLASVSIAEYTAKHKKVHVIGTTGFTGSQNDAIASFSQKAVFIKAGNMSLGVNLLTQLTQQVASSLDSDFDIEIVESHHRYKVDAPSGTALMLGDAAAKGRGIELNEHLDKPRFGQVGPRLKGNIGFSNIRGGDIVGEHEVIFAANGERIVLKHIATDRNIYTYGAIKAALWGLKQPPGLYNMKNVLGLQ